MEIIFHKSFLKLYGKLPVTTQRKFEDRLLIFQADPLHEVLHNHALIGKWKGVRSIDITGDYRAIYSVVGRGAVKFYAIGMHSQLYNV